MRLTAYTLEGPWQVWEGVDAWLLDGPRLLMRNGHTLDTVALPREVIGLADDSSARHVTDSRASQYRPAPEKLERDWAEPSRSRFGDSPRRRQFRGDGS